MKAAEQMLALYVNPSLLIARGSPAYCYVKHAHVSQTLLASLYVDRLDSLLVFHFSTYVLHLYKERSNKHTADPV
jgi:hypothetical protein